MGRFRVGEKLITFLVDNKVDGSLLITGGEINLENVNEPAKLFVDEDGKIKFKNRGDQEKFIGDGIGSGSNRSVIQGDKDPNEYHDMISTANLSNEQIEYYNDVKAASVGDTYIDNENFFLYVKKREFRENTLPVWIQRGSAFKGEDGESTINGILSNETHTVVSTVDGLVSDDLSNAGGKFTIYDGTSLATNVAFSVSIDGNEFIQAGIPIISNGVELIIDSEGYYTLSQTSTGWLKTIDTISFILRATVGLINIDKTYRIFKSKGSALLRLTTDRQAFTRNGQGSFAPAQQTARLTAQLSNISTNSIITWRLFKLTPDNVWIEILNPLDYLSIIDNVALLNEQKFGDAIITLNTIGTAIKVRAEIGTIFDEITFITVADGVDGTPGADGTNAKAIKLTASSYQVAYNSAGGEPNPLSITLTATGQNLSPGSTYQFLLGPTVVREKNITNTFSISIGDYDSTFIDGTPLSYTVKAYEGDEIVADDVITIIGTKEGASTISVVLSNSTHAFTADANGNVTSEYNDGATGIILFEGNNKLDAVSTTTLANGQFRVVATATNISVNTGVIQIDGKEIVFTPSSMLQNAQSAKISYAIYVKNSTGIESQLTQIQTFSKSKAGQEGASGTAAMVVKLLSSMYQIPYNSAGSPVSPGNFTLTATVQNHVPASYVFEKSTNDGASYQTITSSGNSATIAIPATYFTTPVIYRVTTLDSDDIQKAQDTIAIVATKDGANALLPVLTNSTHAFPADSDGIVTSDYSEGATGIKVFEGNNALAPVSTSILNNGQFKVSTSPVSISVGAGVIDTTNKEITFTPSSMIADSAKVTYTITAKDSNGIETILTQVQTFSKSKAGATGASGIAARIVKLESTKYQLPYNSSGAPVSPGNFTLTATAQNHVPSSYEFSQSTNNGSSYSTLISVGASTTIDIPSSYFSSPVIYRVITKDLNGNSIAQDSITVIATKDGANALLPVLTNSTHAFPADSDGSITNLDYVSGATDIQVYEGNNLLIPVSSSTSLSGETSKYKVIPTATNINVSVNIGSDKLTFTPQNGSMSQDSANVSYSIIAVDSKGVEYTFTQIQTFSKSKRGTQGAVGATGDTGAAGADGRAQFQGTGDPNVIDRYTTATSWATYSLDKFKVPTAEAQKDWEEVKSAKIGDRYVDVRTGLTYIKDASNWETRTVGLLTNVEKKGQDDFSFRTSWFADDDGIEVLDDSRITRSTYYNILSASANNSINPLSQWIFTSRNYVLDSETDRFFGREPITNNSYYNVLTSYRHPGVSFSIFSGSNPYVRLFTNGSTNVANPMMIGYSGSSATDTNFHYDTTTFDSIRIKMRRPQTSLPGVMMHNGSLPNRILNPEYSYYFDGTSGLTFGDHPSFDLTNSSNNTFTIESWVYVDSPEPDDEFLIGTYFGSKLYGGFKNQCIVSHGSAWMLDLQFDGLTGLPTTLRFSIDTPNFLEIKSISTNISNKIKLKQWAHVVLCRNNGVFSFYVNGEKANDVSTTIDGLSIQHDSNISYANPQLTVGWNNIYSCALRGYLYNTRIINKYSAYNSTFVPPNPGLPSIPGVGFTEGTSSIYDGTPTVSLLTCRGSVLGDVSRWNHSIVSNSILQNKIQFTTSPTSTYPSHVIRHYKMSSASDLQDSLSANSQTNLNIQNAYYSSGLYELGTTPLVGGQNNPTVRVPENIIGVENAIELRLNHPSNIDYAFIENDKNLSLYKNIGTPSNSNYNLSISLWVYIESTATDQIIFSKGTAGGGVTEYLLAYTSASKLEARVYNGGSAYVGRLTTNSFNLNQWYHITFAYNGGDGTSAPTSSNITIYVNGVLQSCTSTSSGTITGYYQSSGLSSSSDLFLGAWALDVADDLKGLIGPIIISNKSLNQIEENQIYSSYLSSFSRPYSNLSTIVPQPLIGKNDTEWIGKLEFSDYEDTGWPYSRSATLLTDPTYDNEGEWVVAEWDMTQVPTWAQGQLLNLNKNRITGIRITFAETKNNVIDIAWIAYGKKGLNAVITWDQIKKNDTTSTKRYPIDYTDIGGLPGTTLADGGLLYTRRVASSQPGESTTPQAFPKMKGVTVSDTGAISTSTALRITGSNRSIVCIGSLTEPITLQDSNGHRPPLQIKQVGNTGGIYLEHTGSNNPTNWNVFIGAGSGTDYKSLCFAHSGSQNSGTVVGRIKSTTSAADMNFTGQHKVKFFSSELFSINNVGLIVASVGRYDNTGLVEDVRDNISINESLPVVDFTKFKNQKSVFGVISDCEDAESSTREYTIGSFVTVQDKKSQDDNRLIVNSIGEGAIWITNINGNFENGDYITSCEIPGYGMKQDDDILHSYTVAKITCDCDFDLNSQVYRCEEFEWNGQTYRKAFVGCTYHCG